MPKVQKYLSGFQLYEGLILNGYKLKQLSVQHQQIVRYQEYSYPTQMIWEKIDPNTNPDILINKLNEKLTDRVIYTSYGNPYQCNFGKLNITYSTNEFISINSTGFCKRI